MATFTELRERLSLDGKQFERVCKWFLETDPRYSDRLVNVWLWDDWPGCWGPDTGIDLVAEDRDGKNWAIQAKCYDPKYSVTKNDVDKFLSESTNENIHHRLLIATTDHLGKNARGVIHRGDKVIPVSQLLLQDLEAAPVIWPENPDRPKGGGPRKPVKRWPHQTQAINNVTKNLGKRGQMISACGTGKTLAALWISERLEAKRTLVLLPSLVLLSQTVSEWLANAKEPFAYLPVCSDDTVSRGNDSAVMFTSDLEYPVTTNPDDIATFLRRRGRQVVFSTYQSSHQIAEAQTLSRVPGFDLVIADEAHRCAGRVSSAYGTVLDDEAIRAKKRLFMTATPRTYTAKVQKKALEADIEVASMDDETVFGPVVHQLNFGEAIERGLLTDYQVVVIGVDDSRYQQMVDQRRIVKTDKDLQTDAETLAKHVAVAKAIRDYGLRRTITFHSRIKTASAFANLLPEVVSWMPSRHRPKVELVTDHVSGEMSTGERNRRLNRLRNIEPGQSAVLTNAQCLSEGIDVPSLDGVAFIDPRRSQVDIVQAVGRAIRRAEDKTIGTIVIPVFLSDTDDPDTALSESEFEPVWSIVRALRSHDDVLGEALDGIRVSMGRRGGGGGLPPEIKFDLPEGVSPKFATAFATRLVEATSAVWEEWFGRLESYVAESGNARPPADYSDEGGNALGGWVSLQRTRRTKGRLSDERADRLESLPGWSWDPKEDAWNGYFDELVAYVATNGHAAVPTSLALPDGRRLGMWASGQRTHRAKGQLSDDKVERLEALPGWSWDLKEDEWNGYFDELVAYVEEHGTSRVERRHVTASGLKLGAWVGGTRSYRSRGKLRADRIKRLEGLPFWTWDAYESDFDDGLAALATWVDQHGHTRVPARTESNGIVLARWVSKRRSEYSSGALSQDRIERLEAIPGWIWDQRAEEIQEWLDALSEFVSEHGHAEVPSGYVNSAGKRLGMWVAHQRTKRRRGSLEESIGEFVEGLPGWVWDPSEEKWEVAFTELETFAGVEGHSRPRQKHETLGGLRLGHWVAVQRQFFKKNQLSPERVVRLEALPGWVWDTVEANWEEAFALLETYVAREGHPGVPQDHRESGFGLGVWVNKQRGKYREGRMPPNKATRLSSLEGWEWGPGGAWWPAGIEALKQFFSEHGHTRVPRTYVSDDGLKLGVWVGNRRRRRNNLSAEQQEALEGFPDWVWSGR
jgi:superfamily II DNA or RNA helicase